eukprot:270652-Amphidinium_carterae.1
MDEPVEQPGLIQRRGAHGLWGYTAESLHDFAAPNLVQVVGQNTNNGMCGCAELEDFGEHQEVVDVRTL